MADLDNFDATKLSPIQEKEIEHLKDLLVPYDNIAYLRISVKGIETVGIVKVDDDGNNNVTVTPLLIAVNEEIFKLLDNPMPNGTDSDNSNLDSNS